MMNDLWEHIAEVVIYVGIISTACYSVIPEAALGNVSITCSVIGVILWSIARLNGVRKALK